MCASLKMTLKITTPQVAVTLATTCMHVNVCMWIHRGCQPQCPCVATTHNYILWVTLTIYLDEELYGCYQKSKSTLTNSDVLVAANVKEE